MFEFLMSFLGEFGDSVLDCLSIFFDGDTPEYSRKKIKKGLPLAVILFILLIALILFLLWI